MLKALSSANRKVAEPLRGSASGKRLGHWGHWGHDIGRGTLESVLLSPAQLRQSTSGLVLHFVYLYNSPLKLIPGCLDTKPAGTV